MGPPPLDLIKRGVRSHEFFTEDGKSSYNLKEQSPDHTQSDQRKAEVEIPQNTSLEKSEEYLDGRTKRDVLEVYERDSAMATGTQEDGERVAGGSVA